MASDESPRVLNSLTGSKERLTVLPERRFVAWYTCGPTVYDSAHIGHARNYVCFDVLRRIVADYFGVDVRLQMNVTDVDDKIIARSVERGVPFGELARHYEREFFEDLRALRCRPPDVLTRVSDYMPDIVRYVRTLVERGYAYAAPSGSVYFDVEAFERSQRHVYGKLEPGSSARAATADGAGGACAAEKRHARDFALWKASKTDDEPGWPSPFGRGRPGWHIECSAMVAAITPDPPLDVHSGGVDLRFPHHDNEIAQAEAYHECENWCRYFLHSGHLHIEGLKMSKSLKNFITIREILRRWSWRQMRVLFLLHRYEAPMNYSEEAMADAAAVERTVAEFMKGTGAELRAAGTAAKPTEAELRLLHADLPACRAKVHACLADNFDTPGALQALLTLIKSVNVYRGQAAGDGGAANTLHALRTYVGRILSVFGLEYDQQRGDDNGGGAAAGDAIVDAFAAFRDRVRAAARAAGSAELLEACDSVRDDVLPPLGVRLEDRPDAPRALWKRDDPASIQRDVERRREQERARAEAKAARKREAEERQREELRRGEQEPQSMFREPQSFSQWREDGVPTHDAQGNELDKSRVKKMAKEQQRQRRLHDKYLEARASGLLASLGLEH